MRCRLSVTLMLPKLGPMILTDDCKRADRMENICFMAGLDIGYRTHEKKWCMYPFADIYFKNICLRLERRCAFVG